MKTSAPGSPCGGSRCSYNLNLATEIMNCDVGDGSCLNPKFLSAEVSPFHDDALEAATQSINEIIAKVPVKEGFELSLINTNMGLLLAWVSHKGPVSPNDITSRNTDDEIRKALKIK